MSENQKNDFGITNSPKTIELDGLSKEEVGSQLLTNEPNTIFTICGNPIEKEEIDHLKFIRSEKQINERNLYIVKLHKEGISNFDIMKRMVRIVPKKDWLVVSSEDEVLNVINKYHKGKSYTMEDEKENIFGFIKLLDDFFYRVCKIIIHNSKALGFKKTVRACNIADRFLHTRGEITGWFPSTIKTEGLHERYKAVVDCFKIKTDNDSEQENDMKAFANKLREMAKHAKAGI